MEDTYVLISPHWVFAAKHEDRKKILQDDLLRKIFNYKSRRRENAEDHMALQHFAMTEKKFAGH